MSLDDLIAKLQVKLANFERKYGMKPHTIILNPMFKDCGLKLLSDIHNKIPYLTGLDLLFSNRVKQDDFEVY